MKTIQLLLLLSIALFSCQSATEPESTPETAVLFSEGVISSELPEFATTINAAGTTLYFNRTTADRSSMQIMRSDLTNGEWSTPEALPFSTGEYLDVDPFLTHDGQRLYFSSTRPLMEGDSAKDFDTWYIEKQGDSWSAPINPGTPLNSDTTEIFITIAKSGNAYFLSERFGGRDVVVSRFQNGNYQEPEPLNLRLNGDSIYYSNPCIASDESFIIVCADAPEEPRNGDLYISYNNNGQWSGLQRLGPIVNSTYTEFAPGLSKDDKVLYFTSERPGIVPAQEEGMRPPGDIYRVEMNSVESR